MAITDIFSFGNLKLPKTTAIFNLPRLITCPGATPACKLKCYSAKAERRFKVARRHRYDMLALSKTDAFAWILDTALTRLPESVTAVRVHESGDFYNQRYVDIWLKAINHFPRLKFYAYTKSAELDFSSRPKNFTVRLSLDSTSKPEVVAKRHLFDGVAWMQQKDEEIPDFVEVFICPAGCHTCSYCPDGEGDVVLQEH